MSSPKSASEDLRPDKNKVQDDDTISLDDSEVLLNDDVVSEIEDDIENTEANPPGAGEPEAGTPDNPVIEYQEPASEPEATQQTAPPTEDPEVEKAVEEIAETEEIEAENEEEDLATFAPKPVKSEGKIKAFFRSLWDNPKTRYGLIGGFGLVIFALALVPNSRYFILNAAQVRASVELKVIDNSTLQPLKNVTVKAANAVAQTDSDGVARLEGVKLGRTTLRIEKRAYAAQEQSLTVGWGSNPLGDYQVVPIGSQYTFYVKDFMSGKPIPRAEASSGDGNARSDEDGKLVLALDTATMEDSAQISVAISAEGYRDETMNITVNNKETQSIEMVPARKHVFVSKRSGKYDVYSIDTDGKNERRIVGGSGYERDDITLIPHPSKNYAAYIATRENTRNQSGYLLSTLYILDIDTGDLMRIDQSERVQAVGWSRSGRFVYVKIAAGASGTDPKRHRLMSFNNEDHSDTTELASSNSFNDVMMANERVYYAPSNIFQETEPAMYVVDPDGKNGQKLLGKEVSSIIRSDYETIHLNANNEWYEHVVGSPMASSTHPPGSQINRLYTENSDGSHSAWIDERDGKGVLIGRNKDSGEESTLVERGGLQLPMYWLTNEYLIYRVSDGRETADYILNISGGESRKITDVTATSGITRWYYY